MASEFQNKQNFARTDHEIFYPNFINFVHRGRHVGAVGHVDP